MVRLEVLLFLLRFCVFLFQFLYGAIGSYPGGQGYSQLLLFQFLYGAIGRFLLIHVVDIYQRFNSYMVRLEVSELGLQRDKYERFNSYMVRLEVKDQLKLLSDQLSFNSYMVRLEEKFYQWQDELDRRFNSYMVRLEGRYCSFYVQNRTVSIPIWCDWKTASSAIQSADILVSIPIWCDWKEKMAAIERNVRTVSIPIWCDWKHASFVRSRFEHMFQFLYGAIGSRSKNGLTVTKNKDFSPKIKSFCRRLSILRFPPKFDNF